MSRLRHVPLGLTLALVLMGLGAMHTSAASLLPGGVDLNAYCSGLYGQGSGVTVVPNLDGTTDAYGLRCVDPTGVVQTTPLNMNRICVMQNPGLKVAAVFTNFHDPYSWICMQFSMVNGSVNFQAYCQSLGYWGAQLVLYSVGGWECVGPNGPVANDQWSFDSAACQAQYGTTLLSLPYVINEANPRSVVCLT